MKKSGRNLLDDECRHCLLSLQTPCCLPNLYRVKYRVLANGGVFKSIGAESESEFLNFKEPRNRLKGINSASRPAGTITLFLLGS
jgi:hypothetical protein